MTLYEILNNPRTRLMLDDDPANPKWSDTELAFYANMAEQEVCRRAYLIKDNSTAAYCTISLVDGTSAYTLNAKVLEVLRAKLSSEDYPMTQVSRRQMDQIDELWESSSATEGTPLYWISEVGTEFKVVPTPETSYTCNMIVARLPKYDMAVPIRAIDISFTASTKKITRTAGGLVTAGFVAGGTINISGASVAGNNGNFTISTVSSTEIVVTETVYDESAGATIILSSTPEIPVKHHYDLVYYICHLAFLKNGDRSYNKEMSVYYEQIFSSIFGKRLNATTERARVTTPMYGGMMNKKHWI